MGRCNTPRQNTTPRSTCSRFRYREYPPSRSMSQRSTSPRGEGTAIDVSCPQSSRCHTVAHCRIAPVRSRCSASLVGMCRIGTPRTVPSSANRSSRRPPRRRRLLRRGGCGTSHRRPSPPSRTGRPRSSFIHGFGAATPPSSSSDGRFVQHGPSSDPLRLYVVPGSGNRCFHVVVGRNTQTWQSHP